MLFGTQKGKEKRCQFNHIERKALYRGHKIYIQKNMEPRTGTEKQNNENIRN
jgi:hypothetical protein